MVVSGTSRWRAASHSTRALVARRECSTRQAVSSSTPAPARNAAAMLVAAVASVGFA